MDWFINLSEMQQKCQFLDGPRGAKDDDGGRQNQVTVEENNLIF